MEMSYRALFDAAQEQHWKVEETKKGHFKLIPPTKGAKIVVVGSTESDHRSLKNTLSRMKKSGFQEK